MGKGINCKFSFKDEWIKWRKERDWLRKSDGDERIRKEREKEKGGEDQGKNERVTETK